MIHKMNHEADFLAALFSNFTHAGINYAVLRNYDALPASVDGSDLDLIVRDDQEEQAIAAILAAIREVGAFQVGTSRCAGFFTICVFGKSQGKEDSWWGVCIDVNVGLFFRGQALLVSRAVLPTRLHNGVVVVDDFFGGVLGVLKEVLNNATVPDRYLGSARTAALQQWDTVSRLLSPMGSDALNVLRDLILAPEQASQSAVASVAKLLLAHGLRSRPLVTFWGRLSGRLNKLIRYKESSGKTIAFLGVDGAGKTTIIERIRDVLDQATHNSVRVFHLRPTVLPPLARLRRGVKRNDVPVVVDDPHGASPSGVLGSLFRFLYLCMDYVVGYWLKVRPLISKKPCVVIFDRYAYDMALDQRRFRINLPGWFVSRVLSILPKPDVVICLYADPAVLLARKQELPLDEVARQVAALHAFASRSDAVLIETVGTIDDVAGKVLYALGVKFSE